MTTGQGTVTVLIPALDEERDIAGCLQAIAAQSYPGELIDVVLVDGCSADRTVEVARDAAAVLGLDLVVLRNELRRTSTSLNVGLRSARGEILVRIDARSRIEPEYVATCVRVLADQPAVGVVGGRQVPRVRSTAITDRAIARALANRFTTGFARYRRAEAAGPTDTVWMGVFRTDELRRLGGWDDDVALNEDWALNRRYRDAGRQVWFEPRLVSGYLPRTSLAAVARQHFHFGRVKGLWWVRGTTPEPRQVVMLAAPPVGALALLGLVRRRGRSVWLVLPAALLVADAIGSDEPAGPATRCLSATTIAVYTGSWWIGTVVGAIGELVGVEHRHGRAPT